MKLEMGVNNDHTPQHPFRVFMLSNGQKVKSRKTS